VRLVPVVVVAAGCSFEAGSALHGPPPADSRARSDGRSADAPPDGPPDAAPITAAFVQSTSGHTGNANAIKLVYPGAEQLGDFNLVVASWGSSSGSVQSISDTANNTYTPIGNQFSSGNVTMAIYYAANIAAGNDTVTVQFDRTVTAPEMRMLEYSGIASASVVDGLTQATGGGQSLSAMLISTTHARDLIVAADTVQNSTDQTDPAFTLRVTEQGDIVMDRFVTATGSYAATAHEMASGSWVFELVALELAN
jgi:hypothetical protein